MLVPDVHACYHTALESNGNDMKLPMLALQTSNDA